MDTRNVPQTTTEDRPQPPDKPIKSIITASLNNGHLPKINGAGENGNGDVEASGPLLELTCNDNESTIRSNGPTASGGKSAMVVSFGPGGGTSTRTFSHLYSQSTNGKRRLLLLGVLFMLIGALLAALVILVGGGFAPDSCANGKQINSYLFCIYFFYCVIIQRYLMPIFVFEVFIIKSNVSNLIKTPL